MFPLLLLFLLTAAAGGKPNRTEPVPSLRRGETATLVRHKYLSLPVYVESDLPPVNEDFVSVSRGTGQERAPRPLRELLLPVRPDSSPRSVSGVTVRTSCELNRMQVRVQRSMLGEAGGSAPHLKLGTCSVSRSTGEHLYFEHPLGECGTKRSMMDNRLVYSNILHYEPPKPKGPIRRSAPFSLPIMCYFNRFVYSYKIGHSPQTHEKSKSAAKFVLKPRNAQWNELSEADAFVLGQPTYFEAEAEALSANQRLYVHTCYATPERSHSSTPRLPIIANHGCMIKRQETPSRFIKHKNNVVRFSVGASVFKGMTGQLYMHCSVFVSSSVPTATAKSCNYQAKDQRWVELYGSNSVCDCCESDCSSADSGVRVISSTSWTVGNKIKPTVKKKKKVTALQRTGDVMSEPEGATTGQVEGAGPGRLSGGVEETHVRGSAVAEEDVIKPRQIFEEIFHFGE